MYTRLLKKPILLDRSFFLFGPRGTGKTTWLNAHFGSAMGALRIDLLNGDLYTELLARPHRIDTLIGANHSGWVVLDEVQRVPSLLNEVHRLIESRGLRFVLTGSSARSLRKKGVNLLGGRALTFHMHPLVAEELGAEFDLDRALRFGQLPSVPGNPDPHQYLKSYVQSYLREEVQQEGLARNLANFSRFLEVASFSQGSPVNVAEIARETGVDRKVVDSYFGILDDLMIGIRVPVFTKRAKRRLIAHPKFYFFDAGVYRTIRPRGPLDTPEEAEGAALETLCLQELRAINDALGLEYELSYWRTADGHEVDFVLYGPQGLYAIEVKRSSRYTRADLKGLRAFKDDYPMAQAFLFYGGENVRQEEGVQILPLTHALTHLSQLLGKEEKF